jgi:hypothetical protein
MGGIMDYTIIIALVVAAIIIILLIKFIQGIFKTLMLGILILVIISAVFGFFFISDSKKLIDNLKAKDTLFLLKDGNVTVTGFTISKMNISTVKSLDKTSLDQLSSYYQKKDMKKMLGNYSMLFIIDKKAFPKTDKFDPDSVIAYITGEKKDLELVSLIKPDIPDPKAMAFSLLVVYSFREDSGYLIKEYKAGNVIIYPETFVLKTFKFILGKK